MNEKHSPSPARGAVSSFRRKLCLVLLVAAVPTTLFAVGAVIITGNQMDIRQLSGGSNYFWSSAYGLAAIGHSNQLSNSSKYSLAVGYGNLVYGGSGEAKSNLAAGTSNSLYRENGFAAGEANQVLAKNASALGKSLIADSPDGVVVGAYNNDDAYSDNAAFVVGVGTSGAGNDKNGLIVLKTGEVIIPQRQGDVSMGPYGD